MFAIDPGNRRVPMDVSVRGRHLDVSEPLKAYAERRLLFSIGEFAPRVGSIDVRVADVNGPRGGVAKACDIEVMVPPFGRLFARAVDVDAYAAVDKAAARIRSVLVRRIRHRAERRRSDPPPAA
jgi:ribosomal subunit interface protein